PLVNMTSASFMNVTSLFAWIGAERKRVREAVRRAIHPGAVGGLSRREAAGPARALDQAALRRDQPRPADRGGAGALRGSGEPVLSRAVPGGDHGPADRGR